MKRTSVTARLSETARHGTASVELALVLPLLMLLLFGSIEVGMLVKTSVTVNRLANEAARMAGVGAAPDRITSHITASASGINLSLLQKVYEHRQRDVTTGAWGNWHPLGVSADSAANNDAATGDQVRVSLNYPYALLFHGLLGAVLRADAQGAIQMKTHVITVRGLGEYREQ